VEDTGRGATEAAEAAWLSKKRERESLGGGPRGEEEAGRDGFAAAGRTRRPQAARLRSPFRRSLPGRNRKEVTAT
jgi:hypothetical protein